MNQMRKSLVFITAHTRIALRAIVLVLLTCALTACAGDEQPTDYLSTIAGIDNIGGQLTVQITQPGRKTAVLTNADFRHAAQVSGPRIDIPTVKAGALNISFVLVGSANDTISAGQLRLDLVKGNVYGISIGREFANSHDFCIGCNGVLKFPIRDAKNPTSDSLWVFYSAGPPLCKGCVI